MGTRGFKTNNIDQGWDGKINGKDALMGVYTYYVKYRSIEDVPIEERGNFISVLIVNFSINQSRGY